MRDLRIILLFIAVHWLSFLHAQNAATAAQGRITDKKTHAPLEFANVRFKGIQGGVQSDSTGHYNISTTAHPKILQVTFLGFKPVEKPVQIGKVNNIDIELEPNDIDLTEVVVKPGKRRKKRIIDTAALYVYHQVVAHKDENKASSMDSYHYNEYTKMTFAVENTNQKFIDFKPFKPYKFFFEKPDTAEGGKVYIPLFIKESLMETWYRRKPAKKINITHYDHISGLHGSIMSKLIGYHFQVTDAYENVHIVFQKSFISPFSPTASVVYNYHILDTAKINGRTSYKLNFVGRVKEDLCTKGYAWIDSATWAIKSISYHPNEKANLDYIFNLLEEQNFELVDSSHWMMTSEHQLLEANLLKNPKQLAVRIEKNTLRKNIESNIAIPDSIEKIKDDIVDRDAYKKPELYIDTARLDTLTNSEALIYHHFDTLKTLPQYKALKTFMTLVTTANIKAGPVDFGRLYRVVSKNNIEGWRVRMGIYTNSDLDENLFAGAYGAYGTKDKSWKYSFNLRYKLPAPYDRWHAIEAEYKNDMLILGQENPLLTYDNILTLISGYTLDKVMRTREFNLYYERDWIKGLSSNITFSDKTFYTVPGAFTFSKYDATGNTINISKFNTTELSADLRYCKTDYYYEYYTYRTPLQTKTPSITFKYTLGLKNQLFGGDYTYHKFTLQFVHRLQLPEIGYSKIMLRGGYILGNAPYP
ncbi:MAG TPA: DUF5686 family protein, partial [Chitinophagales bacterium]|nr:DUF5686 family protein [Chitinophagales bacterium]